MPQIRSTIFSLLGLSASAIAFGQENETLSVDVAECVDLDSEAARFACYEERVNAARASGASATAAQGSEPEIAAPSASAAEPAPSAAAEATASRNVSAEATSQEADEPEAGEIFGTITELRETIPDSWVITLDNGQVWQMNQSKRYPLRVGLEVRLSETRWGPSYRLTALEHGGFVTVRRVR